MVNVLDRAWIAAWLVGLAVLCLVLGDWVTFVDEGEASRHLPLALLAAALGLLALVTAWPDRWARQVLGSTLVTLVFLMVLAGTYDGFRFVWARDEGELFYLELLLSAIGLLLLAPPWLGDRTGGGRAPAAVRSPGASRAARAVLWLVTAAFAAVLGFNLGVEVYEVRNCSGPGVDDCDVAVLGGLVGAAIALVVVGLACVVVVLVRSRRHSHRHGSVDS